MGEKFEFNKIPDADVSKIEIDFQIKLLEKMKFALLDANNIRHELNELIEKNIGKVKSEEDREKEEDLTKKLLAAEQGIRLLQIDGQSVTMIREMETGEAIDKEIEKLRKLL